MRTSDADALAAWRRAQRERLVAAREALGADTLSAWRARMDAHLERAFPGLGAARVALCWPIRNEYDARHLARRLRARGATTALPVVVARAAPLEFRTWRPGDALVRGPLGIPYPSGGARVAPQAVLLPMNGWDAQGYRLGYGGGFFDRTLAAARAGGAPGPLVIGVAHELARMDTIRPQVWDVPVDWLVTERGVYRRDPEGLAFLGAPPPPGGASALASPVCYAAQFEPQDGAAGDPG